MAAFDPAAPAPFELLVIWGPVKAVAAMTAVYCLELAARQVFCVGNDDADVLRDLLPTRVLILPGADSPAVEEALSSAVAGRPSVPVLDLRPVQA